MRTSRGAASGRRSGEIEPIYKRLPHGPHALGAEEVASSQRARLLGATIEAVHRSGYEAMSVKDIISLAWVSRRAFYEQFANKEECFLATADVIAARAERRIRAAYRAREGDFRDRMAAAFEELAEVAAEDPKGARLLLSEAQTAGLQGLRHLQRATLTFETLLQSGFSTAPEVSALPPYAPRAMVGALHWVLARALREPSVDGLPGVCKQMLAWTLLFDGDTGDPEPAVPAPDSPSSAASHPIGGPAPEPHGPDDRRRILGSALLLAVRLGFRQMTPPQIADAAGVRVAAFFRHFASKEECFLAALDAVGNDLRRIAASADTDTDEWPRALQAMIGRLLAYLAARPDYALALCTVAPASGAAGIEHNLRLVQDLARLVTRSAPARARSRLARETAQGAIWHIIQSETLTGNISDLRYRGDAVSYVVMVPFIGPERAAEAVYEPIS